jgi:hypothetical protein
MRPGDATGIRDRDTRPGYAIGVAGVAMEQKQKKPDNG